MTLLDFSSSRCPDPHVCSSFHALLLPLSLPRSCSPPTRLPRPHAEGVINTPVLPRRQTSQRHRRQRSPGPEALPSSTHHRNVRYSIVTTPTRQHPTSMVRPTLPLRFWVKGMSLSTSPEKATDPSESFSQIWMEASTAMSSPPGG
jgi:hypothetical protein